MLNKDLQTTLINFLKSLQATNGGYSNSTGTQVLPQSSLSVMKTLEFFGISPNNPDGILGYFQTLYDPNNGSFIDPATTKPSVFTTAMSLISLNYIGAKEFFQQCLPQSVEYMNVNAASREEHFMFIGVIDECKLSFTPTRSIAFFREMENNDGSFGSSILDNAIASSALLRIGETLNNPQRIETILLSAQNTDGGFAELGQNSSLWVSYCVMRALNLLKLTPKTTLLEKWIENNLSTAISKNALVANDIYQYISILDWIIQPILTAAKTGDVSTINAWIQSGGDPDTSDFQEWTPLMAAAVRGQFNIVNVLLNNTIKNADTTIKLTSADASAIFWAGQSGDINTATQLLKVNPNQLYEISRVNGHNILLQAAFFGSERHLKLAEWILSNIANILNLSNEEVAPKLLDLTKATNVRGYNVTSMSRLWGNKPMEDLFLQYDKSTKCDQESYLKDLLQEIAPAQSSSSEENLKQELVNDFISSISNGFSRISTASNEQYESIKNQTLSELKEKLTNPEFDINFLGGALSETPIIVAVTGVDTSDNVRKLRYEITKFLLDNGSDPDKEEKHPMAVDSVIRSAVLNHFEILKLISNYMKPLAFAAALNYKPPINGQTALQDTVHRALTADNTTLISHLEQIKWCISKGARYDIEDHTGTSPEKLARSALNDSVYASRAADVLEALGITNIQTEKALVSSK